MNNSANCLANNRTARSLSATGAASFAFMYAVRFFAGCFFYFYYYFTSGKYTQKVNAPAA